MRESEAYHIPNTGSRLRKPVRCRALYAAGLSVSDLTNTENQIFVSFSDLHFDTTTFARLDVHVVPLPSALLLLTSGLIGIAGLIKRRSA